MDWSGGIEIITITNGGFKMIKELIIKMGVAVIAMIVVIGVLTMWGLVWSFPLMLAWNYVVPDIFGLGLINYWQMFCLYAILTSLWKVTVTTVKN